MQTIFGNLVHFNPQVYGRNLQNVKDVINDACLGAITATFNSPFVYAYQDHPKREIIMQLLGGITLVAGPVLWTYLHHSNADMDDYIIAIAKITSGILMGSAITIWSIGDAVVVGNERTIQLLTYATTLSTVMLGLFHRKIPEQYALQGMVSMVFFSMFGLVTSSLMYLTPENPT